MSLESNYEGESAMLLEAAAVSSGDGTYQPGLNTKATPWTIETRAFVAEMARQVAAGVPPGIVAGRFHDAVARTILSVCREIRERNGLNRVCLSGGTFQNLTLLKGSMTLLAGAGFEVFSHAKVPPNDGGISLGQAAIAATWLERN
jgi:hydrogenase maturation protein HypF